MQSPINLSMTPPWPMTMRDERSKYSWTSPERMGGGTRSQMLVKLAMSVNSIEHRIGRIWISHIWFVDISSFTTSRGTYLVNDLIAVSIVEYAVCSARTSARFDRDSGSSSMSSWSYSVEKSPAAAPSLLFALAMLVSSFSLVSFDVKYIRFATSSTGASSVPISTNDSTAPTTKTATVIPMARLRPCTTSPITSFSGTCSITNRSTPDSGFCTYACAT
mmetsp:Transcript_22386/g.69454  ORF Transcript_22386/g.69454 Transcript_22386/m.69454 type:complete len:219 (-) Transcript_22386:160-816(-)